MHRRNAALAIGFAGLASVVASGCGSLPAQDAAEPKGTFPIRVVSATFPGGQKLAKNSDMKIVVENAGQRALPNVNVTVKCPGPLGGSFTTASSDSDVADPQRPQFIVNTLPTRTPRRPPPLDSSPLERSSAFVDTYPLGRLQPGGRVTFLWNVTAVRGGPYKLCWRVNAGLYGKAKAVAASGGQPVRGIFSGVISNVPPKARVTPSGQVTDSPGPGTGRSNNSSGQ